MSYSLNGIFVDVKNKKVICEGSLDFLKCLNVYRYSRDLGGIYSSGSGADDMKEVTTYIDNEYRGKYLISIFDEGLDFPLVKKDGVDTCFITEDDYEKHKDVMDKHEVSINDIRNGKTGDTVDFFVVKEIPRNGDWYVSSDFTDKEREIKESYEKNTERLKKLEAMLDTKEYFEMSSEGKMSLEETISDIKEELEDDKYKLMGIEMVCNLFEFFNEDCRINGKYYYDDDRKVELYLWVC